MRSPLTFAGLLLWAACLVPAAAAAGILIGAPALGGKPRGNDRFYGANDPRNDLCADLLAERLAGKFPLVERKALGKLLAEQELALHGFVRPEDAARVGKLVGARFLLTGRVFTLGDNTVIAARLVSVESGRLKGVSLSAPEPLPVERCAERLADELGKHLARWQDELLAPPEAAPAEPEAPAVDGPAVAVLNFANLGQGDDRWDWLGEGLADLTIGTLAGQGLRVVSREQMQ